MLGFIIFAVFIGIIGLVLASFIGTSVAVSQIDEVQRRAPELPALLDERFTGDDRVLWPVKHPFSDKGAIVAGAFERGYELVSELAGPPAVLTFRRFAEGSVVRRQTAVDDPSSAAPLGASSAARSWSASKPTAKPTFAQRHPRLEVVGLVAIVGLLVFGFLATFFG